MKLIRKEFEIFGNNWKTPPRDTQQTNDKRRTSNIEQHGATSSNMEQHRATWSNMEQHRATWSNIEQHGATSRKKPMSFSTILISEWAMLLTYLYQWHEWGNCLFRYRKNTDTGITTKAWIKGKKVDLESLLVKFNDRSLFQYRNKQRSSSSEVIIPISEQTKVKQQRASSN